VPDNGNDRSEGFVPTSDIRRWAADRARISQLKIAPVVKLPRDRAFSALAEALIQPIRFSIGSDEQMRQAVVGGAEDKVEVLEKKYPGFTSAMVSALRQSFQNELDRLTMETAAELEKHLTNVADEDLSTLAASTQPMTVLLKVTDSSHLERASLDAILDSPEGRTANDLRIRYLDIIASRPGGMDILDALHKANVEAMAKVTAAANRLPCAFEAPMRKAAVDFLLAHEGSASARLFELSLKARAAASGCTPQVPSGGTRPR
jgi:hypothetical protein